MMAGFNFKGVRAKIQSSLLATLKMLLKLPRANILNLAPKYEFYHFAI